MFIDIEYFYYMGGAFAALFFFNRWRTTSLEKHLEKTKKIKLYGIIFKIKKISPINFMEGSSAIQQIWQTYEQKKIMPEVSAKKIKDHYIDVFCASVVEPKLVRKQDDAVNGALFVDNLFTDWALVNDLYTEITKLSYGKKKF